MPVKTLKNHWTAGMMRALAIMDRGMEAYEDGSIRSVYGGS